MFHRQKRLRDQILVITGATSGIGLATATLASQRGARLVLAARSAGSLEDVAAKLGPSNRVITVPADVGRRADVEQISQRAIEAFGGFDTWINNAGQTIYGRLEEISEEDLRALMEVNFWGTVNGSLVAAAHLKQRGGTLINVGSIGSDFAFPLQGMYSASKHAIRGFTDALRMELEQDRAPISITLIKPASIDTPLPQRARNYMNQEPDLPPPVYRPREVAEAILAAATSSRRDVYVGGGGKAISVLAALAPRLFDLTAPPVIMAFEKRNELPRRPEGSLHGVMQDGKERGSHAGFVNPVSVYTRLRNHPGILVAALGALAVAVGGSARRRRP